MIDSLVPPLSQFKVLFYKCGNRKKSGHLFVGLMVTLALINKNLFLQISSCSTSDSMDPGCNLIEFFVKVYLFGRRPSSREAGEQLLNKKMTKRALLEYFSILQISILISFGHPFQSSVLS